MAPPRSRTSSCGRETCLAVAIEAVVRLVEQHQKGPVRERQAETEPLALAERKAVDAAVGQSQKTEAVKSVSTTRSLRSDRGTRDSASQCSKCPRTDNRAYSPRSPAGEKADPPVVLTPVAVRSGARRASPFRGRGPGHPRQSATGWSSPPRWRQSRTSQCPGRAPGSHHAGPPSDALCAPSGASPPTARIRAAHQGGEVPLMVSLKHGGRSDSDLGRSRTSKIGADNRSRTVGARPLHSV